MIGFKSFRCKIQVKFCTFQQEILSQELQTETMSRRVDHTTQGCRPQIINSMNLGDGPLHHMIRIPTIEERKVGREKLKKERKGWWRVRERGIKKDRKHRQEKFRESSLWWMIQRSRCLSFLNWSTESQQAKLPWRYVTCMYAVCSAKKFYRRGQIRG